jgi:ribonuclease III
MTTQLMKRLGYTFKDIAFLALALSHRSFSKENNERMEFLGDSILNFVIAEALYVKFPEAVEGQLSRLRANIVNGNALAEVGVALKLGECLHLGVGEKRSGGHQRASIIADAVEAIIAAIYLDSDFLTVKQHILAWFEPLISDASLDKVIKDPKSALQELLQAQALALPEYDLIEAVGKEHEQTFKVACKVENLAEPIVGSGTSRRRAEQDAAEKTLTFIKANQND